jgi:hypothetical protein
MQGSRETTSKFCVFGVGDAKMALAERTATKIDVAKYMVLKYEQVGVAGNSGTSLEFKQWQSYKTKFLKSPTVERLTSLLVKHSESIGRPNSRPYRREAHFGCGVLGHTTRATPATC